MERSITVSHRSTRGAQRIGRASHRAATWHSEERPIDQGARRARVAGCFRTSCRGSASRRQAPKQQHQQHSVFSFLLWLTQEFLGSFFDHLVAAFFCHIQLFLFWLTQDFLGSFLTIVWPPFFVTTFGSFFFFCFFLFFDFFLLLLFFF